MAQSKAKPGRGPSTAAHNSTRKGKPQFRPATAWRHKASLLAGLFVLLLTGYLLSTQIARLDQPAEPVALVRLESSVFVEIAQYKGLFLKHGLNTQIKEYPSGPQAVADVLAGKLDFAVAAEFVGVNSMFANDDLRIVAQVASRDLFRVIARRDGGISNAADLKGKTIGVTKKSAGEFFLARFLTFNDIGIKDVQLVNLSPTQMSSQLSNGNIDALITLDPTAYNIERELGETAIVWAAQGGQESIGLAYASKAYIQARPDVVRRFITALVEAEQFVATHNQEARDFVAKKYHYDSEYMDHYWPTFDFSVSLNQALLVNMEAQARWVIDNGLTEATKLPNYLNFIYLDGLEAVKPETITIIR